MAVKLPIGIQDFRELITGGYVYVDKTKLLYQIMTEGKPYFLTRPRRFGKSLTISTLEAIFKAKRDLFKGLWIDQSDWDWQEYPVIRLDMSNTNKYSPQALCDSLRALLTDIAKAHNVKISGVSPADYLRNLIQQLSEVNKVVVLVDEYDKPIIDNLNHPEIAQKIRDILKDFYSVLKSSDANLKFIFLTGVTKFSKVSVFSGLNNLKDITMHNAFSAMLGYTREEIEKYFANHTKSLASVNNISVEVCKEKIKDWYNGYRFASAGELVYNPFSMLSVLDSLEFKAHWFATGTPTFLLDLIKTRDFDLENLEAIEQDVTGFETFEIQDIPTVPLLYQTGYFTVKQYDPELDSYVLGYPNYEVSFAFTKSLLNYFATSKSDVSEYSVAIARNLKDPHWDQQQFFDLLKKIMATMPYDLYIKEEKYYHSIFYLILKQAGLRIHAEYHTRKGRADAVLETNDKILVFEIKYNKTAEEAMQQIKEQKYFESFLDLNLPIYLIGINFNGDTREVDDWLVEELKD